MCVGQCDSFYAVVTNGPAPSQDIFKWTITGPGGFTSMNDTDNLFFCAQLPGTYTFFVSVTTVNGGLIASDTFTLSVVDFQPLDIISDNPAPCNFDSSGNDPDNACEKVCPNTTVTYSVTVSGNPGGTQSFISWQVNGASSYTVNPPFNNSVTVVWGEPGVGSVSVFTDAATGCSGEDALCVTVIAEPAAAFTADPAPVTDTIQICKGQTVYFENQSAGADSYEWLFGDDLTTSLDFDPAHTFFNPGIYTVSLIARSNCLCADTTTVTVEVLDAEAPALDCVGTLCPGETVTYTASNACPPFNWSVTPNGTVVSGGTATTDSITVQWNAGPEGIIMLGAQPCSGNVCPNPASIHVPIISDDAEIRGEDRVCPAATEVYSIEPYGGTNFNWTLSGGGTITEGQGTNRVTIEWTNFPNPNTTYWLSVEYDNCYLGCGGKDSLAVRVLSPFVINGPVELCENASGNFASKLSVNGQNIACNWTLFAPDGSTAWTSAAPTATPAVPFANGAGIYRLLAIPDDPTLTCSDQADWAVNIAPQPGKPTGITGETNICAGTTYSYQATGVSPTNNLRWTVQNGSGAPVVSFGDKINVTWGNTDPRWISVAQVSTNGLNCASDTALLTVQSIGLLFISGSQVVCEDSKASYSILSLQNIDIQWQISPPTAGAIAGGQGTNAAEIFWTEPGGHVVSVDVCGQMSFIPVTVIALPDPMVQYSASVCPGNLTPVQTTTPYVVYSWRDAAGTEIATTPTLNLGPGSYYVRVEDGNGCPGTSEFTVVEDPSPNVSITTADPTGFCNNSSFVTLSALAGAGGDFDYEWFNNGTPLGVNAPTLTTNQYGSYTVQVTNAAGCTATAGSILLFNFCGGGGGGGGFPGAGDPPCPPGSVDFTANMTGVCDSFGFQLIAGPQYQPGSAFWTFGISGGAVLGTSNDENPDFIFPNAGKYIVVLRVMLQNGAFCTVVDSVKVLASAQFTGSPACAGDSTDFQDASTFLPGSGISEWEWNFGDPGSGAANTSDIRNPKHSYSNAGNPSVTLTITAINGCTASATQTFVIPSVTPATFTPPALQCEGNALEFIANTGPEITQLLWNFGDLASGAANDASGSPVYHNFNTPSNYAVTTTVTNVYGCTASLAQIITIAPNALNGNITPANPAPICEGNSIVLTAPPGAVSYVWSDGTTTSQSFTATEEGTYSVTLTDASGCTYVPPPVNVELTPSPDALIKAVLENELGQIVGTAYPTLSVCDGEAVHLIVQGNGVYGYSWSGGNGSGNEVYFNDLHSNLLTVGSHVFTVTVTEFATGCTSVTDPFVVTVNPVPDGFSISAGGFCAGDANLLTYTGPQPANWQFIWSNGATGTSLTTEDPGLYYIRVINEFGCEAKSNPLVVLPGPNVAAIPGGCHTRCRPDTLCLPFIPGIVSWQWYFNGSPVPGATGPDFTAQQSGVYYAELTDVYGCTNQSDPLTLNLYDGSGNIAGQVWSDVNGNGIVDAGDTLVSGISVNLLQNGSPVGAGQSGPGGDFVFSNVLSANYVVEIDSQLLPPGWEVIIGQNAISLSGCGAIANSDLLLHICLPLLSTVQFTACANDSVMFNGIAVPAGTTQSFLLSTPGGCDSTVMVTVEPIAISGSTLLINVCPNEVYDYNGTLLFPGDTEDFVFQNYLGCDSIVTITVSEVPASASSLSVSVCPGAFYDYYGALLAAGQTQDFNYQNSWGCDSIVTVIVTEAPTSFFVVDAVACEGDTLFYNGVGIPAGSGYTFQYQNSYGCDSIVEVAVGILPPPPGFVWDVNVCPGQTYTYNGVSIAAGDSAVIVVPGTAGCDTLVTVIVHELQNSSSALDVGVCPGETFVYQGVALTAGAVQDFVLNNWLGCDSVVTVTVSQLPVSAETIEVEVCPGATYNFNGTEIPAGTMQEFHFIGPEGCDSSITVVVMAFPEVNFSLQTKSSCPGSATGNLTVTGAAGGLPPYRYSLDGVGFQDSTLFDTLSAGDYTVFLEDSNGCIFEEEATIAELPGLDVELPDATLPCNDPEVQMDVVVNGNAFGLSFRWSNGATGPTATFTDVGPVWVEVTNACETVRRDASVDWADPLSGTTYMYIPNVFAPDSDHPDNSEFKPFFQPNLTILTYKFEIFDRWGNNMFSTDQPDLGWRGSFRADDMKPAVFVWYIKTRILFCGRERDLQFEGDVTVVR